VISVAKNQSTIGRHGAAVTPLLLADDVRRAGALGGLFDVEFDLGSFRQILTANVFHVEEHVVVSILSVDESVTACVVEEINRTVCHYKSIVARTTVKGWDIRF
jgi:hypothetical protein